MEVNDHSIKKSVISNSQTTTDRLNIKLRTFNETESLFGWAIRRMASLIASALVLFLSSVCAFPYSFNPWAEPQRFSLNHLQPMTTRIHNPSKSLIYINHAFQGDIGVLLLFHVKFHSKLSIVAFLVNKK